MSVHEPLLIASLADRETQLREGRIERDGMLETDTEMGRMKLEFTRVTQDKMLELERRSGFHYWISRGNPASMVVSRQVADEMLLDILQSGGSLTRLEPWSMEKAEQVQPNLGQSMEGGSIMGSLIHYMLASYTRSYRYFAPMAFMLISVVFIYSYRPNPIMDSYAVTAAFLFVGSAWLGLNFLNHDQGRQTMLLIVHSGRPYDIMPPSI